MRVSALRSLGAYMNVFALESFMDELARWPRKPIPVAVPPAPPEGRARHAPSSSSRPRSSAGRKTVSRPEGRGRGFAFAHYKNLAAYCAVALEVEVDDGNRQRSAPIRAVAAVDSGQVVNPDGIRNQIEGGIVQSLSWTLYEQVAFDAAARSPAATGAPIRSCASPTCRTIEVHVIDRPGRALPRHRRGGQGPAAAALANAIADATGARIRDLPLRPERVKAAFGL